MKIYPFYEVFYIENILTKIKTAIADYEFLKKVITDQKLFEKNPHILIDLAENIIINGAAISRYFVPSLCKGT